MAVNASGAAVACVEVPGLTPGAAVAFDGLPTGYGTAGIYADADGKAYLWLPEDWASPVTPKLLSAARRGLSADASLQAFGAGTAHTFAANGYSYTVEIPAGGGTASAEKGAALKLSDLAITGFAVEEGWLLIGVKADPATWLYGFADTLRIRAAASLPIPDTDESLLDLSAAELRLEDGARATLAVPLPGDAGSQFFSVEAE